MIIYFDGGCNPNPGMMETCYVVNGKEVYDRRNFGIGTNNVAEWSALIDALLHCEENGYTNVTIYGDSKLVVNQAMGTWKIKKDEFNLFKSEADRIRSKVKANIVYVPRDKNLAGIYLEHGTL